MATLRRTQSLVLSPQDDPAAGGARRAPPHLLRCLVVSPNAERRRLIRAAAESQAWDAILCRDAGEFLRAAFKRLVPLVVVDLPSRDSKHYWELREATDRARQAASSLLVVAGADGENTDEIWARKLGVWGYLSEANSQRGFELIFSEARRALARSETVESAALACVEEDGW
jgi:DNA-binding response OmpR family regulator